MDIIFTQLTIWHWWGLAAVLFIIEMVTNTSYLLWIGLSAVLTGFFLLVIPSLGWQWQFLIFALDAIANIAAGVTIFKKTWHKTDDTTLNRRGSNYIGQVFVLQTPIVHGRGHLEIDGIRWRIVGADAPVGSNVRVVGLDGVILKVRVSEDRGLRVEKHEPHDPEA